MNPSSFPNFQFSIGNSVLSIPISKKTRSKFFYPQKVSSKNSHPILFLETIEGTFFHFSPSIPSPGWIAVSNRHSETFKNYTYFLIFAKLDRKNFRYGVYLRCKNDLLEFKWALYTHIESPLYLKIHWKGELWVSQLLFEGNNFNFFFPWEECKKHPLHIHITFSNGVSWEFSLKFQSALSI